MMKKKYLRKWQQYNKQQNLCSQRKNDANDFMKRTLITKFYKIWKKKVCLTLTYVKISHFANFLIFFETSMYRAQLKLGY